MPFKVDVRLWSSLAQFMAHASDSAWDKTMESSRRSTRSLDAFDELEPAAWMQLPTRAHLSLVSSLSQIPVVSSKKLLALFVMAKK